jgi:hypothetical protein
MGALLSTAILDICQLLANVRIPVDIPLRTHRGARIALELTLRQFNTKHLP